MLNLYVPTVKNTDLGQLVSLDITSDGGSYESEGWVKTPMTED